MIGFDTFHSRQVSFIITVQFFFSSLKSNARNRNVLLPKSIARKCPSHMYECVCLTNVHLMFAYLAYLFEWITRGKVGILS